MNTLPSAPRHQELATMPDRSLAKLAQTDIVSTRPEDIALAREAMRGLLVPTVVGETRTGVKAVLDTPTDEEYVALREVLGLQNALLARLVGTNGHVDGQVKGGDLTITRKLDGTLKVFVTTTQGNEHYIVDNAGRTSGIRSNRNQAESGEGTMLTALDLNQHLRTLVVPSSVN